ARVEAMRGAVERLVEDLLESMAGRPEPDLVRDYAALVPVYVMCDLLGIPSEHRMRVHQWSNDLAVLFFASDESHLALGRRGLRGLTRLFPRLIQRYRVAPADNLISELIHADEGNRLTDEELVATSMMLLFGGHVNTTNLIANGL